MGKTGIYIFFFRKKYLFYYEDTITDGKESSMIGMRLEMDESVMEALKINQEAISYFVAANFPGMELLPPRKEGDVYIMEATLPDEQIADADRVMVCSLKFEPSSKYDYDIERRFKMV